MADRPLELCVRLRTTNTRISRPMPTGEREWASLISRVCGKPNLINRVTDLILLLLSSSPSTCSTCCGGFRKQSLASATWRPMMPSEHSGAILRPHVLLGAAAFVIAAYGGFSVFHKSSNSIGGACVCTSHVRLQTRVSALTRQLHSCQSSLDSYRPTATKHSARAARAPLALHVPGKATSAAYAMCHIPRCVHLHVAT